MVDRPYLAWNKEVEGINKNPVKNSAEVAGLRSAQSQSPTMIAQLRASSPRQDRDRLDWRKDIITQALDMLVDKLKCLEHDAIYYTYSINFEKLVNYLDEKRITADNFKNKSCQKQIEIVKEIPLVGLKGHQAKVKGKDLDTVRKMMRDYFSDVTYGYKDITKGLLKQGRSLLFSLNIAINISKAEFRNLVVDGCRILRYDHEKRDYALKAAERGEGEKGDPKAIYTVYGFISAVLSFNWRIRRGGQSTSGMWRHLEPPLRLVLPYNPVVAHKDTVVDAITYIGDKFEEEYELVTGG